jgi:hypothetical protein
MCESLSTWRLQKETAVVDSNLEEYAGKIVGLAAMYSRESAVRAWRVVGLKYYPKAAR